MVVGNGARETSLDGLRGVAALAVVWSHVVIYLSLAPTPPLGGMGVLVFFVLSGYLIAHLVAREPTSHSYAAFVRRRAVRLGPAIAALVAVEVLAGHRHVTYSALYGVLALTQTLALARAAQLPVPPILVPTWSLTVEWTFYLLFPLWYLALKSRGRTELALARWTLIAATALYLAGLLIPSPDAFYNLPVANLGVMMVGAALGLARRGGWATPELLRLGGWPWAGAAMILIFTFLPGSNLTWEYRLAVLPLTTAASTFVILGCAGGHPVQRLLGNRFFANLGIRAYSLYLWHMPVLWMIWHTTASATWKTAAITVVALVPVVEASYRLLEKPVLRGGRNALALAPAKPVGRAATISETSC